MLLKSRPKAKAAATLLSQMGQKLDEILVNQTMRDLQVNHATAREIIDTEVETRVLKIVESHQAGNM